MSELTAEVTNKCRPPRKRLIREVRMKENTWKRNQTMNWRREYG